MTTIEKIHAAFEVDLLTAFQDLNAEKQIQTAPAGLSPLVFKEMLSDLQIRYPSYNYVSKQQVKDICVKYKLVTAPLFMYNRSIPAKNIREMEAFKIQERERYGTYRMDMSKIPDGDRVVIRSAALKPGELDKPFLIVSFTNTIQGVLSGDLFTVYGYDGGADIGTPLIIVRRTKQNLNVQATREGVFVQFEFERKDLQGGFWMDYAQRSVPLIVAPSPEFIQHPLNGVYLAPCEGGTFVAPHNPQPERVLSFIEEGRSKREFLKGAERKAKEAQRQREYAQRKAAEKEAAQRAFLENQIKDPIVLQPLPAGGFLVVSKWGNEANLPEIQNQIMN